MEKYNYPDDVRAALEGLQQPLAVYQLAGGRIVTLLVSDGFCRLLGYGNRSAAVYDMDHDMYRDVHPDDRKRISEAAARFVEGGDEYNVVFRTKAGMETGYRVIHAHGRHAFTESGVRLAHVWYMDEGVYEEESASGATQMSRELNIALHEESILQAAHHDMLTGLPNLTWFFSLSEGTKARLFREGKQAALLYMDLNGMKYYNHRFGFAEGDKLLRGFAALLAGTFGHDECCHIGADRFAVCTADDRLEERLHRFLEEAERAEHRLPVRIGIYSTAAGDVPVSTAYDRAKLACDALRRANTSAFGYYSDELQEAVRKRQYIQSNIDRAICEKWISVYYQPIVRAVNGRVCEEEALARWADPAEGVLRPSEFVPYLEDAGLVHKLDLYVLEQVLEKIRLQRENGLGIVPHSINLSRVDFEVCDIVEEIRRRVDEAGLARELITIEVTESVIGKNFEFMKAQVARFRELGFPVWMDDFGSGYSSFDVLQSVRFDLIKFDMSFMNKLDDGESGKIILTDLMKMAASLKLDTVCEGVETAEQVRFLQEIGCAKLQGFFFCRPIPFEEILERYRTGRQIGFEDPATSAYFDTIGRINLYDLDVIANREENDFVKTFDTLPMGIIEIKGDSTRFVRSNPSYRSFIRRFFGIEISAMETEYAKFGVAFMKNLVRKCCEQGNRAFYDEKMADGSVVHSFARRIGTNPVTGETAVAIAVLSVSDPAEGESYSDIARAMAADYYRIYAVDLDTENFIEYSSAAGRDELALERHGADFFESARKEAMTQVFAEDRELFLAWFTRENVIRELDRQGVFTMTYRLMEKNVPVYAYMKSTRMRGTSRIILGVSIIDPEIRERQRIENALRERDALAKIMALAEDYLTIYSVDADTGHYVEYSATPEYKELGLAGEGADFFAQCIEDGKKNICREDLPAFLEQFSRKRVMGGIREKGTYRVNFRLMMQGEPVRVTMKIIPLQDGKGNRLLAGIRRWRFGS